MSIVAGFTPKRTIDGFVTQANSMNGLGLGAFDSGVGGPAAKTCCYRLNLNLKPRNEGEYVTFSVSVANGGDGLYESAVCGRAFFV